MLPPAANHRDERIDLSDERAQEIGAEYETLTLTARDWEAFLAAWDDVDRPRPRLEAAMRRYRSRHQRDAG